MDECKLIELLVDMQNVCDITGIECNVITKYGEYYQDHKQENGTFRFFKGKEYQERMQERYDYCLCKINCCIENNIEFNKYHVQG